MRVSYTKKARLMWQKIQDWDRYEVCNDGRVRSIGMLVCAGHGSVARRKGMELTPVANSNGYYMVTLTGDKKRKQFFVHNLVATAFIGPKPEGYQTAHNDGDQKNNAASNLRYVTPIENCADRDRHGTTARGESHGGAILTELEVLAIRASTLTQGELGKIYKVNPDYIWAIRANKRWKHLNKGEL